MTAPIFYEKEYELEVEIQQIEKTKVMLKAIRTYYFHDVWEARNEYEKFFFESDDKKENEYADKQIIMTGNKKQIVFTQIYIYLYSSIDDAKIKRDIIVNNHRKYILNNQRMQSKTETLNCAVTKDMNLVAERERILNISFEEMGMSSGKIQSFLRLRISNLRELIEYEERRKKAVYCGGRYLTKTMMEELIRILKERNWEWVLQEIYISE